MGRGAGGAEGVDGDDKVGRGGSRMEREGGRERDRYGDGDERGEGR